MADDVKERAATVTNTAPPREWCNRWVNDGEPWVALDGRHIPAGEYTSPLRFPTRDLAETYAMSWLREYRGRPQMLTAIWLGSFPVEE